MEITARAEKVPKVHDRILPPSSPDPPGNRGTTFGFPIKEQHGKGGPPRVQQMHGPSLLAFSMSAPASSSCRTTARWPLLAAAQMELHPLQFNLSLSAPASNKNLTTSWCPLRAAAYSGVCPLQPPASRLAGDFFPFQNEGKSIRNISFFF